LVLSSPEISPALKKLLIILIPSKVVLAKARRNGSAINSLARKLGVGHAAFYYAAL
jgi:hypothetical protein